MIEIKAIDFSYPRKRVIRNMSLSFTNGGVYGLLGENGTGKSTIIKLISGLLKPQEGSVEVFGIQSKDRSVDMYQQLYMLPEEIAAPQISLGQYVKVYSSFYPSFSQDDFADYVSRFSIELTAPMNKMSMGQFKKCMLAFCFATNCKIMLLDEPTNGLDIPSKSVFRQIVAQKADDQRIIVISTHQVRDVDSILDSVTIITNEATLLNTTIARVESRLAFVDAYGVENYIHKDGNIAVLENVDGIQETPVNIEVLFTATLHHPERIASIVNRY